MLPAEIMMMQICGTNMLQLISRILTIVIPDQQGICYPMTFPCKISIVLICSARKGSMLFAIFLGLFRLMKIKNKLYFVLTNTHLYLALAATWLILIASCFPYIVFIPSNRTYYQNLTGTCACSFFYSLTDMDLGVKIFDWVCGVGSLYFVIVLMCFVSIKMVLILLKHQKTVFVGGTLNRSRTRQRDIFAIKAVIALLVCYVTCSFVSQSLRHYLAFHDFDLRRIIADIYNLASPVILGYPYFRKLPCKSWHCHRQSQERVRTIS